MLHIKYRPKTLDEIIGNKAVKVGLQSLFNENRVPHSILFQGTTGTGKTTFARIIANFLKCKNIREINASDTRGIDFARQLIQDTKLPPLLDSTKVYILDECQSLTTEGQQSLLKLFEEPPDYAYFIFCTTNPEKLLPQIRNRCFRFTTSLLSRAEMISLLRNISEKEMISLSQSILEIILMMSEGIPRTALILLDLLRNVNDENVALDLAFRELYEKENIADLCKTLMYGKWENVLEMMEKVVDYEKLRIGVVSYFGGCLRNAKHSAERKKYIQILNVLITPLHSSATAKYELLMRFSEIIDK